MFPGASCCWVSAFLRNVLWKRDIKKSQRDYPESGKLRELLPNPQRESALRTALRGNYHLYCYYYLGGIKQ